MVEKNRNELSGVLLRRYPPFVWSDAEMREIPVFAFHSVTHEFLEPLLQYLVDNGYATLTADEYTERFFAGEQGAEREVLLTFDDGYKSLYTVAYPMLKRFGQKAVAYIVPGRTPEKAGIGSPSPYSDKLCNWSQIQEMHESGAVDFQAHSMYHHSVATSDRLTGFLRPGISTSFLESDLSPLFKKSDFGGESHERFYGYPIYDWGSRMAAAPAFKENPYVCSTCIDFVASHGGDHFFNRKGWQDSLLSIFKAAQNYGLGYSNYETEEEQRRAILMDLRNSKAKIEKKLYKKVVRHFCFPWFRGSALSVELSGEAGYTTNAWGSLLPGFLRSSGMDPFPIRRLPPKYILRLPGNERSSLFVVFMRATERSTHQ